MPITDFLRHNAAAHGDDIALVEVNPEIREARHVTWRDYNLVQSTDTEAYRREISWRVFDEKANRFANLLISRGVKKGDKVAILLMNCLEWLPVYFGVLKSGATVVPLNFRYTAEEIEYCVNQADVDILLFGPQFIGRIEEIVDSLQPGRLLFYVGEDCPSFAENYRELTANCSSSDPMIPLSEDEDAAIYFSSGTTGFPKAILHHHRSLTQSAEMEQKHHGQTRDDVFLCIPPLYHTGAKMHWFGSLISASKAILLRGVNPENILDCVNKEQCTIVWLLVPWVQDILVALESGELKLEDYKLDQWRLMHVGAQPVPKSLIQRWKEVFPHHDYDTNYGLSESTGPGCVHLGVENIDRDQDEIRIRPVDVVRMVCNACDREVLGHESALKEGVGNAEPDGITDRDTVLFGQPARKSALPGLLRQPSLEKLGKADPFGNADHLDVDALAASYQPAAGLGRPFRVPDKILRPYDLKISLAHAL